MKKHIAAGWRYVRYGRIVLGWIVMSTFLLGFLGVVKPARSHAGSCSPHCSRATCSQSSSSCC